MDTLCLVGILANQGDIFKVSADGHSACDKTYRKGPPQPAKLPGRKYEYKYKYKKYKYKYMSQGPPHPAKVPGHGPDSPGSDVNSILAGAHLQVGAFFL